MELLLLYTKTTIREKKRENRGGQRWKEAERGGKRR
jgi:hypothetical protein